MIGKRLRTHQAAFQNVIQPSLKETLRWVKKDVSGHWFWQPSVQGDLPRRFDPDGWPIWSWCPPKEKPRRRRGIFVVARVLLHHVKGPFPSRSQFQNTCGLSQCVNPDHWSLVPKPPIFRLLECSEGWRPYLVRTGTTWAHSLLLAVSDAGVIHTVEFPADWVKSARAFCGKEVYLANTVVMPTGTIITCKEGC